MVTIVTYSGLQKFRKLITDNGVKIFKINASLTSVKVHSLHWYWVGYQDNLPLISYDLAKVHATSSVVIQCQSLTKSSNLFVHHKSSWSIDMINMYIHNNKPVYLGHTVKLEPTTDLFIWFGHPCLLKCRISFLNHVVSQIVFWEVNFKSICLNNLSPVYIYMCMIKVN